MILSDEIAPIIPGRMGRRLRSSTAGLQASYNRPMTAASLFDRVRSYLTAQAASKSFEELRGPVEEARAALLAEVKGLTDAQAAFSPVGEGESGWSIAEVLRHCIHDQEAVALRVRALGLGDPARPGTVGRVVGRSGAGIADLVRDLQAANFALDHAVGSIAGKEKLEHTAPHPWFGELDCRAWYLFQRIHDMDHVGQIRAIKANPRFPSG
jgi:hypothetical protein